MITPVAVITRNPQPCGPNCSAPNYPTSHHSCLHPTYGDVAYCVCDRCYGETKAYFRHDDIDFDSFICNACNDGDHTRHILRPPVPSILQGW